MNWTRFHKSAAPRAAPFWRTAAPPGSAAPRVIASIPAHSILNTAEEPARCGVPAFACPIERAGDYYRAEVCPLCSFEQLPPRGECRERTTYITLSDIFAKILALTLAAAALCV